MPTLPDSIRHTSDAPALLAALLRKHGYSQVAVLVDTHTEQHCLPRLAGVVPYDALLVIEPGEEHKTLDTVASIWKGLTERAFDRKGVLINLGGGVIGDMGGFAAACYKRGIAFINVPTTLLSQVDASVGGKLGIDFEGFKNHIGAFQEPNYVLIDPAFLATLPQRELRSGYAEVLKHALIADAQYWKTLTAKPFPDQPWEEHITHSVQVKYGVVAQDPKEAGLRKILNFGHTVGHAVETYFLESGHRLLHGEAIAVGMIAEAFLSTKLLQMPTEQRDEIAAYLLQTYGKVELPDELLEQVVGLAGQDKKNEGSTIYASLLKEIGQCAYHIPLGGPDILDSLFYYRSL